MTMKTVERDILMFKTLWRVWSQAMKIGQCDGILKLEQYDTAVFPVHRNLHSTAS